MLTFKRLEQCLLPPPETIYWNRGELRLETYTTRQKIGFIAINILCFLGLVLASPFTLGYELLQSNKKAFVVDNQSKIKPPCWPPNQRGFATSFFQLSGLGTKWSAPPLFQGKCDWDNWMPEHVLHKKGFDCHDFFTDVLSNPIPYIQMLKNHHVTAHRFSLEWAVIEPEQGKINQSAVGLYTNFIHALLKEGIAPSITLSHFTVPQWFYEKGNFQKTENIQLYLDFSLLAISLFPEVKHWWSFNEIGIKAFQQAREVYPPDLPLKSPLKDRVHAAGTTIRNMLIAHCKLHEEVRKRHPDIQLGITHQWLKFDTEQNNLLERVVAYFLTKFSFTPVFNFFKGGHFAFEFPFMANIHLVIPEKEFESKEHFLMCLGVQAYPTPMLKMGLNHGRAYPGTQESIRNFSYLSFGSSCEPGGTLMRFGPRCRAENIDQILDEAFSLTSNVYITEIGADSSICRWGDKQFRTDYEVQCVYLKELLHRVHQYTQRNFREIQGLFCWSDLRRQLEWDLGQDSCLGVLDPDVDRERRMVSYRTTPASRCIAETFGSNLK